MLVSVLYGHCKTGRLIESSKNKWPRKRRRINDERWTWNPKWMQNKTDEKSEWNLQQKWNIYAKWVKKNYAMCTCKVNEWEMYEINISIWHVENEILSLSYEQSHLLILCACGSFSYLHTLYLPLEPLEK